MNQVQSPGNNIGVELYIPGGPWLVRSFWTKKGIDNPLAVFGNFIIAMSWALLCVVAIILALPQRTARDAVASALMPQSLQMAAQSVSINATDGNAVDADRACRARLWGYVEGGGAAQLSAFEPHLCTAPFQDKGPALRRLTEQAEKTIIAFLIRLDVAVGVAAAIQSTTKPFVVSTDDDEAESIQVLRNMEKRLEHCVGMLEGYAKGLQEKFLDFLKVLQKDHSKSVHSGNRPVHMTDELMDACSGVVDESIQWLEHLQHPAPVSGKEACRNTTTMLFTWLAVPFLPVLRLSQVVPQLFQPKKWSRKSIIWALQLTSGYVAIFVASLRLLDRLF